MSSERPRRIVLTGASRGLGLEFTRLWLDAGHHVFALARSATRSAGLAALAPKHPGALHVADMDVADDASVAAAAERIAGTWDAFDLLLNNAGIYGPTGGDVAGLDFDACRQIFEVNTLGPLRVTRALLPLLRRGREPKLVHMTSNMGSISDNSSGGSYPYRMSKTALNMASRNLAHDLQGDGIPSIVLHPGWVRTDMGGPGAPLTIAESVSAMARTIDHFTVEHSGGFYDRNGERLAW